MAQESILARLMGVAEAHIMLLAPDAPEAIQDEATIRLAAYLYDVPNAGRRDSFSNSYVNSGAAALLTYWTPRAFADSTGSTPGGTSGGLSVEQVEELIQTALAAFEPWHWGGGANRNRGHQQCVAQKFGHHLYRSLASAGDWPVSRSDAILDS